MLSVICSTRSLWLCEKYLLGRIWYLLLHQLRLWLNSEFYSNLVRTLLHNHSSFIWDAKQNSRIIKIISPLPWSQQLSASCNRWLGGHQVRVIDKFQEPRIRSIFRLYWCVHSTHFINILVVVRGSIERNTYSLHTELREKAFVRMWNSDSSSSANVIEFGGRRCGVSHCTHNLENIVREVTYRFPHYTWP